MVDGLFFCSTLTGRRGSHTPFVQAGAETSDTCAEAVKPDPGSSWEGHSGREAAGVGAENPESCGVVCPLRIPLVICPVRRTYVVVSCVVAQCHYMRAKYNIPDSTKAIGSSL